MLRLLLVVLVLAAVALVVAVKFLPWWAILVGGVVLVVVAKVVGGRLLKRLFLAPFRAKGAVLRGARAEVHAVAPTAAPAELADDDSAGDDARYYAVEVTIHPHDTATPFRSYDPSEIALVRHGAVFDVDGPSDQDQVGEVVKVEVHHQGAYHPFDEEAPESNRFRLTTRVRPGPRVLAFRYYFETFGELRLPVA